MEVPRNQGLQLQEKVIEYEVPIVRYQVDCISYILIRTRQAFMALPLLFLKLFDCVEIGKTI